MFPTETPGPPKDYISIFFGGGVGSFRIVLYIYLSVYLFFCLSLWVCVCGYMHISVRVKVRSQLVRINSLLPLYRKDPPLGSN